MPTTDLFNNLSAAASTTTLDYLSTTANNGQSFISGSTAGTLSSVTLDMENLSGSATGTLTAYLYSDVANLPFVSLATIGTISNSALSTTAYTDVTITPSATISLLANTNYYIVLTDSATNAKVTWAYTGVSTGTGVAGTYYTFGSTTTANPSTGGAPWIMDVAETPTCYASGVRIRTVRGEAPVESLRVGDSVVTAAGESRPIRWIGRRTLHPRRHVRPEESMPVRIAAHALGADKPARDLVVSPGHAIALDLLGEVLIPAGALINGATITQEDVDAVTYWHVELDSHDLLVAENQPAESFLDMGNRGFFVHDGADNSVIDFQASPDADPALRTHANFCRPFHDAGGLVETARAQLRRRAEGLGWRRVATAPFEEARLEVDGTTLRPELRGSSARFALPAGAEDVWLVNPTSVPLHVGHGADGRMLGVKLVGLTLDDGWGEPRAVALDDPLLGEGFHDVERGAGETWRWTAGRARLPAQLWSGMTGPLFLRLEAESGLPRWIAPEAAEIDPPQFANA